MRDAVFILAVAMCVSAALLYNLIAYQFLFPAKVFAFASPQGSAAPSSDAINTAWHPPNSSWITDLSAVVDGSGIHGFIFNSSALPAGTEYGTYNWCNMPHVRRNEYLIPDKDYELDYVELIHRHHKRTPYASNTFFHEGYPWHCSDEGLFYYGQPLNPTSHNAASTYWQVYQSSRNPFAPSGFNGTCQFPQITREGLEDSWQHGKDLFGVYHDLLHFLPRTPDDTVGFRVTNNVITSQVAGMIINAMYPSGTKPFPLQIQPASIDSLEPTYFCAAAASLISSYAVGSKNSAWTTHLNASRQLYASLDAISGVSPSDSGFHQSWDHYFDNLSARQCHAKPLPCNISTPSLCITQEQANEVYRLGQYEYSYIYRGAPESLQYATASYGVWLAELAQNIRDRVYGKGKVKYRHNIAHDGSVSRLLAILQLDVMVWPGMGSEVVFEVYKNRGTSDSKRLIRVLWGGKAMRSSNPSLGLLDMVDADILLGYIDALVGTSASEVVGLCKGA